MATTPERLARIERHLYGNGQAGIVTRVKIIEQHLAEQRWWLRAIGSAIILWVLGQVLGLL